MTKKSLFIILLTPLLLVIFFDNSGTSVEGSIEKKYIAQRATQTPIPNPTDTLPAPYLMTAICNEPGTQVTYRWYPVEGATGYRIANNPISQGSTYVSGTSYTTTSSPGSTMKWYVAAQRGLETGPESFSSVTCASVPPPTNVQTTCSGNIATTTWKSGTGVTGVYGQFNNLTTQKLLNAWQKTDVTSASITVPNNNTISGNLFSYVTVGSLEYYSNKVTIPEFTCPVSCVIPSTPVVTVSTNRSDGILISWTNVANEAGYTILRDENVIGNTNADTTNFLDSSVSCDSTSHSYRVVADNICGESSAIAPVNGKCINGSPNVTPKPGCYTDMTFSTKGKTCPASTVCQGENGVIVNPWSAPAGSKCCAKGCGITTITPTPTIGTNCTCNSNSTCDTSCTFVKYTSSDIANISYSNPIGCSLSSVPFSSTATQTNKNQWCQRNLRTKGDATGDGKVDDLDYFYYVQAVSGGTLPIDSSKSLNVNPDFSGNGSVGTDDRIIIIHALQNGL